MASARRSRANVPKRRRYPLERWVVFVIVLAAIGVAAVGAMGVDTADDLGASADRTATQRLALRHYESAMYSRSAIDTGVLKAAAAGANPLTIVADAARLQGQIHDELGAARELIIEGGVGDELLGSFDAMVASMNVYVARAITLSDLLVNHPEDVPAHLVLMVAASAELEQRQFEFGAQVVATSADVRDRSTAAVASAMQRILLATGAAVVVLLFVAAGLDRRLRRAAAAKQASDLETRETSARLVDQVQRQDFAEDLREALDAALDEPMTLSVLERALCQLELAGVAEVLLADSSSAHVRRVVATNDAPGCGVGAPNDCPAVRRGQALVFESSEELRACPYLSGRPTGPLSATCVPPLFNGRGIGVLHATGPDRQLPTPLAESGLRAIAHDGAQRIGTMRVLATSQFQAKTDGLTGMINRRTLEERLRELVALNTPMTLAMVDLDHFKRLNETYGHEGGDRALRVFSTVVHESLRGTDIAGRYGGEEFALAFPDVSMAGTLDVIERLRTALRSATESGACPPFTASFGVAEWQRGMTVDDLLRVADERLGEAKRRGRDRVVSADDPPIVVAAPSAVGRANR